MGKNTDFAGLGLGKTMVKKPYRRHPSNDVHAHDEVLSLVTT